MVPAKLSLDERQEIFGKFLAKYTARGFTVVSRSPTTAELYKPARFPTLLFKEETLFLDIDDQGRIYVRRS